MYIPGKNYKLSTERIIIVHSVRIFIFVCVSARLGVVWFYENYGLVLNMKYSIIP